MNNSNTLTLAPYSAPVDLVEVRRDPIKYPRVCASTKEEASAKMIPIVYAAALYAGQEIDAERIKFFATALVDEIIADTRYGLRYLSWLEVGRAIRQGVLGYGREVYGISVATLFRMLIDYANGEGHEISKKAHEK